MSDWEDNYWKLKRCMDELHEQWRAVVAAETEAHQTQIALLETVLDTKNKEIDARKGVEAKLEERIHYADIGCDEWCSLCKGQE